MHSDLERVFEIITFQREEGYYIGLVLMQDAVIITKKSMKSELLEKILSNGIKVYVLDADCKAKGIAEKVVEGIQKIGYEEFIDLLMEEYEKTISF